MGSEKSFFCNCKARRRSSALNLLRPRAINALVIVACWKPIVVSGRGFLTASSCCFGCWDKAASCCELGCDVVGEGKDWSACCRFGGRSTSSVSLGGFRASRFQTSSCKILGLRSGFQSESKLVQNTMLLEYYEREAYRPFSGN